MATTNLGEFLKEIADAIRAKTGKTDSINAQSFASEIMKIGEGLPIAYQRLKYIESTKKQCIIIYGFQLFPTDTLNCRFSLDSVDNDDTSTIIGSTNLKLQKSYARIMSNRGTRVSYQLDKILDYTYHDDSVTIGSTTVTRSGTPQSSSINLVLFADHDFTNNSKARVYSLTLSGDVGERLNLIPCYRKIDGVAGLYDTVNQVFFTAYGNEDLIRGPEIE